MVRNIPNEMTVDELKGVIDSVCYGRYDFIYLRVDFAKSQNVGYAFVNFLTPEDLLRFVDRFDGQEYIKGMGYHPTRGPRRGEMAYATNQGQDCVIEKFRNSSIMCEYPGYRPKLFWSEEDAPQEDYIGVERVFPGVNNLSKHNRSKDNAAQIGLYAPKNRRGAVAVRSSQYDRGTPAQMQEDAFYHHQQQMVPNQYPWEFNEPNYVLAGQHMTPMSVAGYPVTYGPPNPFYHSTPVMNGSPLAYAPMTAYNGSPGPMTNHGMQPSRLRTITQGRLGASRRRQITVHPGRDYETAIRQIEEGKREIAEYEAAMAARDAQEAAEAASFAQAADVPRFTGGEDTSNGNANYHNGYVADNVQYSNGAQHVNGAQYANGVQYANGEYANGQFTNGYGGYQ
jgi:hypothetical protein